MHKAEYVLSALRKIEQTVARVIANSEQITSYNYEFPNLHTTILRMIADVESGTF